MKVITKEYCYELIDNEKVKEWMGKHNKPENGDDSSEEYMRGFIDAVYLMRWHCEWDAVKIICDHIGLKRAGK